MKLFMLFALIPPPITIAFLKGCLTNIITKGSLRLRLKNNIFFALLKHRTRQLRFERANSRALEEANKIISAYLAFFIGERGSVRVPRSKIREYIGKYRADIVSEGSDYVIKILRCGSSEDKAHGGE